MIRRCCYCKRILGEKEPFEDHRITDGICDFCFEREKRLAENAYSVRRAYGGNNHEFRDGLD